MTIRDRIKELRRVPAAKLIPNSKNWRRHPKAQERAMRAVLEEIGFAGAVLAREDAAGNLVLIDGHLRARTDTPTDIPVLVLDVTEAEADKILATYDPLGGMAEVDGDAWAKLIDGIQFTEAEFGDLLSQWRRPELKPGLIDDDEIPELPPEAITKQGDLWELGGHRLLCGDCRTSTNVARLLGNIRPALMLTDPPYGINIVKVPGATVGGSKPVTIGQSRTGTIRAHGPSPFGGKKKQTATVGRKLVDATEYYPIYGDDRPFDPAHVMGLAENHILFGGNYYASRLPDSRCWLVWNKNNTGHFADCELAWTDLDHGIKLYSFTWNGLVREGLRAEELVKRVHPTQKPVGLLAQILEDFSTKDDAILDLYLGSGSTLIACEKTGRLNLAMEIEPLYCDLAINRWEAFTGKKARLA